MQIRYSDVRCRILPSTKTGLWVLNLLAIVFLMQGCAGKGTFDLSKGFAFRNEAADRSGQATLKVPSPSRSEPVTAAMSLLHDEASGELLTTVKVRIEESFYLHDFDDSNPSTVPLTVTLELPEEILATANWQFSDSIAEHGVPIFRDEVTIFGQFQVAEGQQLGAAIRAVVRFQACSSTSCLSPDEIELSSKVQKTGNQRKTTVF